MRFITERIGRLLKELSEYICSESVKIKDFKFIECGYDCHEIPTSKENWSDFKLGDRWGGKDKHFWFKTTVVIPQNFEGKEIVLEVKTGKEGEWDALNPQFIVYVNGKLIQGMDVNHRQIILSENASSGEIFEIAMHAYSGMIDGLVELNAAATVHNSNVEKLYYDIKVPLDVAVLLDKEDKNRIDILNYLENAVNLIDLRIPFSNEFNASVLETISYLKDEFYGKFCGHENVIANSVGHTHIDVAWLWTLAQTREKAARSFSTVLNLMKQYPEYTFMSSQPQLYKYVKEDFPEIYEQIKERVKEGRWEPEGAMWLEADCNISSGESLVRQLLFGLRFFKEEFGVESKILWLPDVFGYSAALPQILKKSGVDYFMTTKISWNEYNKIPFDTFNWEGIDGTEILTHFVTSSDANQPNVHITTYNANLVPSQVMGSWQRYQQKDINNEVLLSFGFGDGGGGPTKEMLENARRMEKGIPGCPKVKIGKALDFFKNLEKKVSQNRKQAKWVGELYLEYHRGTYTSMARNKKYNRKSEFLYQEAELFNVLSTEVAGIGSYPGEEINAGWETILLNQFHDILPGSSIKEVYEDSLAQYIEITQKGKKLINTALDNIASQIALESDSVVVFNQLGFERSDIVELALPESFDNANIYDSDGNKLLSQLTYTAVAAKKLVLFAQDIPAKGYKSLKIEKSNSDRDLDNKTAVVSADNKVIENKYFTISFDGDFNITSLFDKQASREVLKTGERANVLQAFEDKPHNYDAWDINIYYAEKMWEINDIQSARLIENGPVRACLELKRKFLNSTITQEIYIYSCIGKIDVVNKIDWKEKQILLKAAFPIDIHTDKATYEIQYGNVERPTHWNTSWDAARFEVCAHKWADVSEDGYGVSLLNDCKYGYSIKGSEMKLTLLKSATNPNPDADREYHEFTYSIYPHQGNWKAANTVNMAYSLNCPVYSKVEEAHSGRLPTQISLISTDCINVVVEVVKKAEDGKGMIVRMYESYNRRSAVSLRTFKDINSIWECDLMERNINELTHSSNSFEFDIKPYEIKTFRIL
ncbi:MAG TPA: alpha-mannosidase [Ruminiclostridium sp.]